MKLNHILIQANNLEEMTVFLTKIIGLKEGKRPPFGFKGAWLYGNDQPIIHLVETQYGENAQSDYLGENTGSGQGVIDHIALEGADYSALMRRLGAHDFEYFERRVPLSSEHQVFIHGPENFKIEMLFPEPQTKQTKH